MISVFLLVALLEGVVGIHGAFVGKTFQFDFSSSGVFRDSASLYEGFVLELLLRDLRLPWAHTWDQ